MQSVVNHQLTPGRQGLDVPDGGVDASDLPLEDNSNERDPAAKFDELGHGGKIVTAASIAAIKGFPILGAYSATKFAVRGIIQAAAQELAPRGITVNGYAPGIVGTGMWDLIDAELSKINGKPIGQNLKENVDSIALGRIETPEDVAKVASFLAGPDSDYVTGQVLLVDGGMLYN